ncbi:hypothetical protein C8F04DRAFT_1354503 [Mycena alexandri]|uniref:Uncharacterized protein n=1 Tax=Mycena alexandri TaxID=1745969 RepID=A0AAD6X3H5_9AGAR|nr:hypothetical protein C8F04DRAFT_1354503 [Mycena alexandri]
MSATFVLYTPKLSDIFLHHFHPYLPYSSILALPTRERPYPSQMSLSPHTHTAFCAPAPSIRSSLSSAKSANSKWRARRSSDAPRASDASLPRWHLQAYPYPLPVPIPPSSLSMPAPSLGSNEILPRPKRGAPPIDYNHVRFEQTYLKVQPPQQYHNGENAESGGGLTARVKRRFSFASARSVPKSESPSREALPRPCHPAVCFEWY